MQRSYIKRQSKKFRDRAKESKPIRDELIRETGKCQLCGSRRELSCHEILRGGLRQKVLNEPSCLIVACWGCNSGPLNRQGEWPLARQLALILETAPERYDLARVMFLRNPNAPYFVTQEEVNEYMTTQEKPLTIPQIAAQKRVCRTTVRQWIESGELPATDVRRSGSDHAQWRIEPSDLEAFFKNRQNASVKQNAGQTKPDAPDFV